MSKFRTKKSLGQHFLIKTEFAEATADAVLLSQDISAFSATEGITDETIEQLDEGSKAIQKGNDFAYLSEQLKDAKVLEIGPGTGVLTQFLLKKTDIDLTLVEYDRRLPAILKEKFPSLKDKIIEEDVLQFDIGAWTDKPVSLVGNFPYNISSQILFKVLENKDQIIQMVGMFQREVAQRICAEPKTKAYGVLSVLTQVYYRAEYLFEVPPDAFNPAPKVVSAVIRLTRIHENDDIDYKKLRALVKTAFNQRRKKLSNALKSLGLTNIPEQYANDRADRLSVEDYIQLLKL